jgi:hypothetical protein
MTEADFEILVHMMNGAHPPEFAVRLLEDTCERTGLSWKARHVYLQKRRNKSGGDQWQAVLSIDGFRAVGSEHPDYAGQEGPLFAMGPDGPWTDIPPEGHPYAAKVGVVKKNGVTTWGVCKYTDYAVTGPGGMMWDKFGATMLAKCAEMMAWRKTFPRIFGGLYGVEEMAQAGFKGSEKDVLAAAPVPTAEEMVAQAPLDLLNTYKARLDEAGDLVTLVKLGKEIQADKRLELQSTLELHKIYTLKKRKYE